jgi:DNA mismatch repair protein MutL
MNHVIHLLPETLINQIAAGEVVERPASVVKELLENSVDAGASDIQVAIVQSGRSSIRVTDNGRGMVKEDLLLAIERHATSKISDYADLMSLNTMGFRGEALPSIAAVSRMTIISIPRGEPVGHRLEIWGGNKMGFQETGGASGTTVEVVDLFYNTPARIAFLKSPRVEWNQIQMAFERVALGFPALRFDLIHNGKKVLQLFPAQDLTLRLKDLWGTERCKDLIPVDFAEDRIRISGFISPPHDHQNTSRNIAFIVNQRWVRSPLLYPLVLRTYAGMIPSGRFPSAILWLDVPPELIDINIHPFKQEVRFSQTSWIQNLVGKALGQALKSQVPRPMGREGGLPWTPRGNQPLLFKESPFPEFQIPAAQGKNYGRNLLPAVFSEDPIVPSVFTEGILREKANDPAVGFSGQTIITQLQGTYLLGVMKEGLLLIDQHAAHERILYERYLSQWRNGGVSSQYLIVPILFELPPGWIVDFETILSNALALGFEVAPAGGNSLWIKSIPIGLSAEEAEKAFRKIMEEITDGGGALSQEDFFQSLLRLLACHSAIRAGQSLSSEEVQSLLTQLDQTDSPSHCPHGRPLWIVITWEEIEKRFKRK